MLSKVAESISVCCGGKSSLKGAKPETAGDEQATSINGGARTFRSAPPSPSTGSVEQDTKYTKLLGDENSPTARGSHSPKTLATNVDEVGVMDVIFEKHTEFDPDTVRNRIVVVANIWPWDMQAGASRPRRIAYAAQKAGAKGVLLVEIPVVCVAPNEVERSGLWSSKYFSRRRQVFDWMFGDDNDPPSVRAWKALELSSRYLTWGFLFSDGRIGDPGGLYTTRSFGGASDAQRELPPPGATVSGAPPATGVPGPADSLRTLSPSASAPTGTARKKGLRMQTRASAPLWGDRIFMNGLATGSCWGNVLVPDIPLFAVTPTPEFCASLKQSSRWKHSHSVTRTATEWRIGSTEPLRQELTVSDIAQPPQFFTICMWFFTIVLLAPLQLLYGVIQVFTQHVGKEFETGCRIATHRANPCLLADVASVGISRTFFPKVLFVPFLHLHASFHVTPLRISDASLAHLGRISCVSHVTVCYVSV